MACDLPNRMMRTGENGRLAIPNGEGCVHVHAVFIVGEDHVSGAREWTGGNETGVCLVLIKRRVDKGGNSDWGGCAHGTCGCIVSG
jgi:hypothetical protein